MRSHSDLRSAMRLKLLVMITLVVSTATTAALFAQLLSSIGAQAQTDRVIRLSTSHLAI